MKKILRVQPVYKIVTWLVLFGIMMVMVFLPDILGSLHFGRLDPSAMTLYYCGMGAFAAVALVVFLYQLQFAVVDENMIVIRVLFFKIAALRWTDIKKITIERIWDYDNISYFSFRWMVITADGYAKGRKGLNWRGKSPWCILASKKNLAVVKHYYPDIREAAGKWTV